ncbi:MAG: hypothetical protein ACRC2S_07875 [Waterburya sp.]
MLQNNIFYCRLEISYARLLKDEPTATKKKSLFLQKDVYVQNFNSINSLKKQIIKLTEIWLNIFPEKEKYWNDDVWRTIIKYKGMDENRDTYPGFMIYNHWNDWRIIGICYKGWHMLGSNFEQYLHNYAINLFGKPGYLKQLEKIQGRNLIFMTPEFHGIEEMFLLSDELVNFELEYFLENKEMTDEIKQKAFYPEMVKKGFIEVLG